MPTFQGTRQDLGVPKTANFRAGCGLAAVETGDTQQVFRIAGTTKDSTGAALASCTVDVFRTADDSRAAELISDANGVYSVEASSELTHYAVAYKAGAPDVAGTTVNTLTGA